MTTTFSLSSFQTAIRTFDHIALTGEARLAIRSNKMSILASGLYVELALDKIGISSFPDCAFSYRDLFDLKRLLPAEGDAEIEATQGGVRFRDPDSRWNVFVKSYPLPEQSDSDIVLKPLLTNDCTAEFTGDTLAQTFDCVTAVGARYATLEIFENKLEIISASETFAAKFSVDSGTSNFNENYSRIFQMVNIETIAALLRTCPTWTVSANSETLDQLLFRDDNGVLSVVLSPMIEIPEF